MLQSASCLLSSALALSSLLQVTGQATVKSTGVDSSLGQYGPVIKLPIVSVASAVLPNGKVLAWSAFKPNDNDRAKDRFVDVGGGSGLTKSILFDPSDNSFTSMSVSNTGHDMFCPGITMIPNGEIVITGGQNSEKTSIYNPSSNSFRTGKIMNKGRGYASSCLLADGKVFVLGGSFSGSREDKGAEVYDPSKNTWTKLEGINVQNIYTADPQGRYRADNYGWFFTWSDSTVFHAGPSKSINWITTTGSGAITKTATRPAGNEANGHAVMFAKGQILACGGAEAFSQPMCDDDDATNPSPSGCKNPSLGDTTLISIGSPGSTPSVQKLSGMNKPRTYSNAIVLPDGKVLAHGGAKLPYEYVDTHAHFQPEIWDPASKQWTLLDAKHAVPRVYHSSAVLLTDGRVYTGGGGLCGPCKGLGEKINHLDAEIFSPPYLFNSDGSKAPQPTITIDKTTAKHGDTIKVAASSELSMVSMVRMGGATHSTNTDQRRLELCGPFTDSCGGSTATVTIDSDAGVAPAGNWMIFGMDMAGTPSIAKILKLTL